MTPNDGRAPRRGRLSPVLALVLLVAHGGCGLDNVEVPELEGPSELALSFSLTATPDIIVADGVSTSLVQATVRDHNGRPVAGRQIFFSLADEDRKPADLGSLSSPGSVGLGTGVVVTTNAQGIAQAIYVAPARTDATANQTLLVLARPSGTDASTAFYRSVRIELRSAEPRLFPENPDNVGPTCDFAVEAPNGFRTNQSILFQSTSFDPDGTIVRYFWDFGDGNRRADAPDVATSYRFPGTYTVTHIVTDDDGSQAACAGSFTIR
jgi:PKD domain-containing protein/Big-like domain-containing protein